MWDLKIKYAFLSNYDEAIFLKQEMVNNQWELHYTKIIKHNSRYIPPSALNPQGGVSLRQCFFYIGKLALADPVANNGLPDSQWVREG
jgi:hypothetical protein